MTQALKTRLSDLSISNDLFDKFADLVTDSDYAETIGRYIYKKGTVNRWTTVIKEGWDKKSLYCLVARHLQDTDFQLGLALSDKTRHIILDLDYIDSQSELDERCEKVIAALEAKMGRPTVVLRSSGTGGRHLRWLLNTPLDRQKLHNYVKLLLQEQGLYLVKGVLELFPGLNHKAIRLPLGKEGAILDDLYNVIWDRTRGIKSGLTTYIALCKMKVDAIALVTDKRWGLVPTKSVPLKIVGSDQSEESPFDRCEKIWFKKGLTGPSQKLRAVTDFAIYLWHQDCSRTEAIERIQKWLTARHNGWSKDYLFNSERELTITIPEAVEFIYSSAEEQGFRRRSTPLQVVPQTLHTGDVDLILEKASDFNEQLWLFSLLSYIKTYRTSGSVVLHCLTVNELRGCSMKTRKELIEKACKLGIISLLEDYNRDNGKARLYKVEWQFAATGSCHGSFESYLLERYSYSELVKKYNRYRAVLIRDYVDNSVKSGMLKERISIPRPSVTPTEHTSNLWELWQRKNSNGYQLHRA